MAAFQVFIEGPVDRTPEGARRLAEVMQERYGLSADELVTRLTRGRFRIKASIDLATAQSYARELERIGARVAIEEVRDEVGVRRTPPTGVARTATPPSGVRPVAAKPVAAKPAPAKPAPKDLPLDLYAPPDAGPELAFELAPDELEHQTRKRAGTPLPIAEPAAPRPPSSPPVPERRSRPSIEAPAPGPAEAAAPAPPRAPMSRARFAAGVAVSIALGFVPAHLIAAARERSAFREIDAHVVSVQSRTDAPLDAAALQAFRAEQKDRKQGERRSIALASMAIWALLGGGLAYVWFRRIPWERLGRRGRPD